MIASKKVIVAIATIMYLTIVLFCRINVDRDTNSFSEKNRLNNYLNSSKIVIIVVVGGKFNTWLYQRALDSLKCYSQIHNYDFIIADFDQNPNCQQNDTFFRRHCVVSNYLKQYAYLLFLDADMGVVNPKRKIEEFIDDRFDITFYDRFFNPEIADGAYLLKNSEYAFNFIKEFADYEKHLPQSFHGTDNGGLHGTGWARDSWLMNSFFNPERDFMLHGWKLIHLRNYTLPIEAAPTADKQSWYDPIIGSFDFNLCRPENTTWNIDKNLIAPIDVINNSLQNYKMQVLLEGYRMMSTIPSKLGFDSDVL